MTPMLSRLRPDLLSAVTSLCDGPSEAVAVSAWADSAELSMDELKRDLERNITGLESAREGLDKFQRAATAMEQWADAAEPTVARLDWGESEIIANGGDKEDEWLDTVKVSQSKLILSYIYWRMNRFIVSRKSFMCLLSSLTSHFLGIENVNCLLWDPKTFAFFCLLFFVRGPTISTFH